MEKFIGKKVLITVAFCQAYVDGGSVPQKFIGVLEKIDGEFLEFSNVQIELKGFTSYSYSNYSNSAIINKQYIIMMVEA